MKKIGIGLLCLALIFAGCEQQGEEGQTGEEVTQEEQTEIAQDEEEIARIFPEMDELVVDGDYVSKLSDFERKEAEEYGVNFDHYTLPMINLDTPYAHYVNYRIQKEILPECIYSSNPWTEGPMNPDEDVDSSWEQYVDYEYTVTDNILSLLIIDTTMMKDTGKEERMFYCYNLDMETGEEVFFKEALSRLGYPEDIMPQFQRITRETIEDLADLYPEELYLMPGEIIANHFIDAEYLFQRQDDQGMHFRYYINEDGFIELPSPLLNYRNEMMLAITKEEEQEEINPAFTLLGIPEDKAYGSYFVGGTYDEETALAGALYTIGIYREFNIPGRSPEVLSVPGYGEANGGGSELYWIVPKYRNAIVRIYGQYLDEQGELQQGPIQEGLTVGDTLIFCNPSETFSNVVVEIEQHGELVQFSPQVSLKDGSNIVGPEGEDLDGYIDVVDNFPEETDEAVQKIMERLREFLPKG